MAISELFAALQEDDDPKIPGPVPHVAALAAQAGTGNSVDDDMSEANSDDAPLLPGRPSSSGIAPELPLKGTPTPPLQSAGSAQKRPRDRADSLGAGKKKKAKAPAPALAAQVADCRAKITELQRWKEQRLEQEDYMGAHHVKQMIQEQEDKLAALRQRLDSMPTPARRIGVQEPPDHAEEWSEVCAPTPARSPAARCAKSPMAATSPALASPAAAAAAAAAFRGAEGPTPSPRTGPRVSVAFGGRPSRPTAKSPACSEGVGSPAVGGGGVAPHEEEADDASSMEADASEEAEAGQWRPCATNPDLVELPLACGRGGGQGQPFPLAAETFEKLYPYQRSGVAWMARLWQAQQGGILADEMGLGKTVQVCAFLNGARKAGATHALMLLPLTLLDQWAKEARVWCPGWPVHIYYGSSAQRAHALRRVSRPAGGILLTTYSMMSSVENLFDVSISDEETPKRKGGRKLGKRRRMDDDDQEDGAAVSDEEVEPELPPGDLPRCGSTRPWDVVVCDEAHKMKSIKTLLGKSLRRVTGSCRLLLTGTPVQNALGDLWSLMDFAQPGLLGNHATFVKKFSDPIDKGSVRSACPFAVELKNHLAGQLRSLISPHLLRRTKVGAGLVKEDNEEDAAAPEDDADDAADDAEAKKLPPKKETIVWLAPTEEQINAYKQILENSEVIREACAKTKLGIEVFRAIGLLKRLCNHPLLCLPTPKTSQWAELLSDCAKSDTAADADAAFVPSDIAQESAGVGVAAEAAMQDEEDAKIGRVADSFLRRLPRSTTALLQQSAKLRCLATLLPTLHARGHRTLVFSSSIKMLDLIQVCCLRPNNLRCLRIDGQTDAVQRAEKVGKWQRNDGRFQCMLLTVNVGGVGLNLTAADRVILVDPAWNPATDAQAVDRAFRIGQTKEVRVYRLIMSGLIEDKMFRLQVFKMGLTRTALEADQQHRYFTAREIRTLFDWTDPAKGETRQMLLAKHGEEGEREITLAAEDDGASDGWLQAGPAVGLSDFGKLYGCCADEDKVDEGSSAQVQEAKQKLGAADEKLRSMADARKKAEANRDRMAEDLELSIAALEKLTEQRKKAEEAVKEKRYELTQARRHEATAQSALDKASRSQLSAKEQHMRFESAFKGVAETAESVSNSVTEAASVARAAEEAFCKAIAEAESQFGNFDESGRAARQGTVDAAVDRLRKAVKAAEKLRSGIDTMNTRHAELEVAEEELLRADEALVSAEHETSKHDGDLGDVQAVMAKRSAEIMKKSRDKDKQRAEQGHAKAVQRAEASRETVAELAQAFSEAGVSLTETFQKAAQNKTVKMDQVKAATTKAKGAFRAVGTAWGGGVCAAAKKAREAWVKAAVQRRKALQKAAVASGAEMKALRGLTLMEAEYTTASKEEERYQESRRAAEEALANAEAARKEAEDVELAEKRRRDELKAAQPTAKEGVRAARAAEKEAASEQQQLHNAYSKVERQRSQMELAKNSAMQSLQAEAYDATQVEQAYDKIKAARQE